MKTALRGRAWLAIASLTAALISGAAVGAPHGELDPTFGGYGRLNLFVDLGLDIHGEHGRALAEQPADGKLVIVGSSDLAPGQGSTFAIVRLGPDGSLDGSFGDAGVATVDFFAGSETANAVLLQPDGKIIVAGVANEGSSSYFAIARLNADGTLDSSFGDGGRATLSLNGTPHDYVAEIALSPDGKLVLAGATRSTGEYDVVFARFLANGTLDASFGTGPVAGTTIVDAGLSEEPAQLLRQPDGKWVACGKSHVDSAVEYDGHMLAIRLNADGTVDAGFGASGVWRLRNPMLPTAAGACVLLPFGYLAVGGFAGWGPDWTGGYPGVPKRPVLVRLHPDGALDTTFDMQIINLDAHGHTQSIVLLDDGYLAVSGNAALDYWWSSPTHMFFARINWYTGLLDPDFGRQGVTIVDVSDMNLAGYADRVSLIRQADGKLTAVGSAALTPDWWNDDNPQMTTVLARVDPEGSGSAGFVGFFDEWLWARENAGEAVIKVHRIGGSTGPIVVDYETFAGSATSPEDFTIVSGTLTWMSGENDMKLITVPVTDDTVIDGGESFRIQLASSSAGLARSHSEVWINDNDQPPPNSGSGAGAGINGPGAGSSAGVGGGGALGVEILLLLVAAGCKVRNVVFTRTRRQNPIRSRNPVSKRLNSAGFSIMRKCPVPAS